MPLPHRRGRMSRTLARLALALLSLSGCRESEELAISRARRAGLYEPGVPGFEFAVFPEIRDSVTVIRDSVAMIRDPVTGVNCSLEIPHSSLVFVRAGEEFVAHCEIRLRVLHTGDSQAGGERSWQERIVRRDAGGGKDGVAFIEDRWLFAEPGERVVEATVEDLSSGRAGSMRRQVLVSPVNLLDAEILPLRFRRIRDGRERPHLSFHLPSATPGITALAAIRNPARVGGERATVRLLRFPSDSLPARPPFLVNSLPGTLGWSGVSFRGADTIWTRTILLDPGPLHTERIPLPEMREGVYELAVHCTTGTGAGEESAVPLERRKIFGVFDNDFPHPARLRTLVGPMQYLLSTDQFSELRKAEDEGELRRRFERIWLDFGRHEEGGKNLINLFAGRVEEANRSFSTFKEGWKTDQGMVLIVFGPPALVEREFKKERWIYGTGYLFIFEQSVARRGDEEIENWILYRDSAYERLWEKELDRWRRGEVF